MKKFYLIIMLLSLAFTTSAQQNQDRNLDNFGRVNLGFQGIGFSYELPVSNKFVWVNSLGAGGGMSVQNGVNYGFNILRPTVTVTSALRFVYNIDKRAAKDRWVENNAGNYIAFQNKYNFRNAGYSANNSSLLAEIHWGMQRNMGSNFLFNFHLGIGALRDFDTNAWGASPTLGFSFAYRLF